MNPVKMSEFYDAYPCCNFANILKIKAFAENVLGKVYGAFRSFIAGRFHSGSGKQSVDDCAAVFLARTQYRGRKFRMVGGIREVLALNGYTVIVVVASS